MLSDGASKLGHESNQALFEARAQPSQPRRYIPALAQRFIKDCLHANGVGQGALRRMLVLNLGAGVSTRNAPTIWGNSVFRSLNLCVVGGGVAEEDLE
jgi:hypothetical protein